MKITISAATVLAALAASLPSARAALVDTFETDSSANYVQVSSGNVQVTHAFDYSALGIASAPNSVGGTTRGLKMEANMTAPGVASGVTLHTNQTFTGAYRVNFDAWINANGPFPGGGSGSTEFLTGGVGGNSLTVNLGGASGIGAWTAVTGEGGASRDYRAYKGASEQFPASGQFLAGTATTSTESSNPYYAQFGNIDVGALPTQGGVDGQTGTTAAGTFGFEWHDVSLLVDPTGGTGGAASVTWSIDGLDIAKLDAGIGSAFATDGSVMIGYMDVFSSVSDAPTYSFGLVDNLRVSAVPEPSSLLFACGLVASGVCYRRRRTA